MDITLREKSGPGEEPRQEGPATQTPQSCGVGGILPGLPQGRLRAEGCGQGTVLQLEEPHIKAGRGGQETKGFRLESLLRRFLFISPDVYSPSERKPRFFHLWNIPRVPCTQSNWSEERGRVGGALGQAGKYTAVQRKGISGVKG